MSLFCFAALLAKREGQNNLPYLGLFQTPMSSFWNITKALVAFVQQKTEDS